MRNDDSRPFARLSSACIRWSCSRDFSTDCRNRSISFRTRSGRSFRLKETKRGSKVRTALPTANPTEPATPWMTRSVISSLGIATKSHKNHKRASCVFFVLFCGQFPTPPDTHRCSLRPALHRRRWRGLRLSNHTLPTATGRSGCFAHQLQRGLLDRLEIERCWLETSRRVRRVWPQRVREGQGGGQSQSLALS